jgi:hypothetical protein
VTHLDALLLQDVDGPEELGSQFEAGLAITATLRSALMDIRIESRMGVPVAVLQINESLADCESGR